VNWRELGLDDYPKIVKKPMALADVKAKLANGSYRSAVRSAAHTRAYHPNFLGRFGVASVGDGSDDRCGMSCVGVQLLVPIAASLSPPPPFFFFCIDFYKLRPRSFTPLLVPRLLFLF
jgi:hypothetical protein